MEEGRPVMQSAWALERMGEAELALRSVHE
jgi:hypothetical protein